jgi:CBS domain-containing protein
MRTLPGRPLPYSARLDDYRVGDIMTPNPVSLRHSITVREAALCLLRLGVGGAPVIDDAGRPLGVLSRSDLVRAGAFGLEEVVVMQVATPSVISARPDDPASRVAELMVERNVPRVFVVDESGVLVGVVTTSSLLHALCGGEVVLGASAVVDWPYDVTLDRGRWEPALN